MAKNAYDIFSGQLAAMREAGTLLDASAGKHYTAEAEPAVSGTGSFQNLRNYSKSKHTCQFFFFLIY